MDGWRETRRVNEGGNLVGGMSEEEEGQLFPPKEEVCSVTAKVFENHLLRDIIVDYAIYHKSGSLDRSTASALRTVGKDWNDSVCKLLHKNGDPFFKIDVINPSVFMFHDELLSQNGNNADLLERFTNIFECSPGVLGRSPTFQLVLHRDAFEQENYQVLYNFLLQCGHGLVRMEIYFRKSGISMKGSFPNLSLPSLQKAVICFDDTRVKQGRSQGDNLINFLHSILSRAPALRELEMCHFRARAYQSSIFESVVLPPGLERVIFRISSTDLEMLLLKNHFPNLTSLDFHVFENSLAVGSLPRLLERIRGTLKNLRISSKSENVNNPKSVLQFPVMEKLEILKLHCNLCYELEPGSLEKYLPKLRRLKFSNITADMLRRWTTSSRFCSVTELILDSSDGELCFYRDYMSRIHLAFPNVTKLELKFLDTPVAELQYIFTQMTNLVELKMIILGPDYRQVGLDWDSLFIGTPVQLTGGLRAAPAFWEKIQLNNDEDPSIRKLTRLQTLSFKDGTSFGLPTGSFISDVTFHFAFLKMPQLKNLFFSRSFFVSQEMTDKWRASGRFFKHTD